MYPPGRRMEIEDQFEIGAQRYVCVDYYEHEIHRWVTMYELKSRCVDCGRPFVCRATISAVRKRQVTRRCEDCRSPGVPVKPRKAPPKAARIKKSPAGLKARRRRAQARIAPARAPQQPAAQLSAIAAPPIEPAPTPSPDDFEAKLDSYKLALGLLDG
jgi:hypothetical protein